jgi:NAD(P)H-dependent flavin oxidoreductase YrpB (nitropropane dioxygenase family)
VLRTPFCELLDIEAPILQAAIWPATSPELVAAVSEAGAIGTIAAIFSTADDITEQIERVRALTDRPFVVRGQSVGLIRDVQPAAKIVQNMVAEAERVVKFG